MNNKEPHNIPPHSLEAEQSVIGSLLLDNERWDTVSERVVASDFYSRPHRLIFESASKMFENNESVDLITLSEKLEANNQLDDVGGFAYLTDLARNTPSAANVNAYADIVSEKAKLRGLIHISSDIADRCFDTEGLSADEVVDLAESKIFAMSESNAKGASEPNPISKALESTLERIEELYKEPHNGVTGRDTGFIDLNKKTAGLQGSDLVIVAARPSMGKTTFAMNLCENVAMTGDKPVLVFSLEMPEEQLVMRMLASLSKVDQTKIRTGQLDDEDWARISGSMQILLEKDNIVIDDSSGLTPTEVRSKARRVARERGGLGMIMIDYLQLMRVPSLSDNRTLEIAEISRSLKALAKELNVPVVALSQLNRSLEQRADKRPVNSDLRESGSIEQDADVIMFIYRDEVYNPDSQYKGTAEIILGKQRNGPIGSVRLTFNGQFSRFDNYSGVGFDIDDE